MDIQIHSRTAAAPNQGRTERAESMAEPDRLGLHRIDLQSLHPCWVTPLRRNRRSNQLPAGDAAQPLRAMFTRRPAVGHRDSDV